jgi:hypothetical protein
VIRGTIVDNAGQEIPFAKVKIKNTSYGTVANAMGKFVLEVKKGKVYFIVSATGYKTKEDSLIIAEDNTSIMIFMESAVQELQEIVIVSKTEKERGKEIMKQAIDKRSYFNDLISEYSCDTYCFTTLEKDKIDSLKKDSIVGKEKLNLVEWKAHSFVKNNTKFKDEFLAFNDFADQMKRGASSSFSVNTGNSDQISPTIGVANDPYLFISGIEDANVNIFQNLLKIPKLSEKPIISPLAYNAFIFYNFYLKDAFIDKDSSFVYEIEVAPKFDYEPLFQGTIYIRDSTWEVASYEFALNPKSLVFFKEMFLVCDYTKVENRLVPTRREFIYNIKEGKTKINGLIRLQHDNYKFSVDDSKRGFWLETKTFTEDAFEKDSTFWEGNRPFTLKEIERKFIYEQDSIINYHESEEYMRKNDSIRNKVKILDLIFNGFGHVNSFKKYEFYVAGLIEQIVPLGIGGYRHRLKVDYEKEFKNGKAFSVHPFLDYGYFNKDLKGSFGGSFTYNPKTFGKIGFEIGDVYDFVNSYQNIQGTLAPGNRVRNKKFEINHRSELINGLYLRTAVSYSDRFSIDNLKYPEWTQALFGLFSAPQPFDPYRILMATFDFEYRFRQRFYIRKNKKVVLGSPWPILNFQYKKGIPNVFGTQANFDYVELRVNDEIQLNTFGVTELKFVTGAFVHKKDLRLIEYKYFRTSDRYYFSNPVNSMQLLDTALNTSNSYMQFNFIHHFKGFFLNKIWLINKLKLEETIGGSMLYIPEAKFAQVEFYVGLERKFRIRKEVFKVGIYAVSADNNFSKASINFKVGFNFFNSFSQSWDY